MDALGGPAESLDPLTLMMASGGIGDPGWTRSDMGGIAIRVQFSNGIPIQVRAFGYHDTVRTCGPLYRVVCAQKEARQSVVASCIGLKERRTLS